MREIENFGNPVDLFGKSGNRYGGRIFEKKSQSSFSGPAIVCLSNSSIADHEWKHKMNSIFRTDDAVKTMEEFKERDDVSHLILVPLGSLEYGKKDMVDDLVRKYLHG